MILKKLINRKEDEKFIINYFFSDLFLRIFTFLWIGYVIFAYNENLHRPESLFEPINWLQKILMPQLPSQGVFYLVVLTAAGLCFLTLKSKKVIFRALLFLVLLWLNCIKWNYNFFSHVGHLFLFAHFFTIFITPEKRLNSKDNAMAIRWALAGVLSTYTMAGIWKFVSLFYKTLIKPTPNQATWLSEDAVELNAIVSARLWDQSTNAEQFTMYNIDYIWVAGTIFIFFIQLISVLGGFNKKLSYFIVFFLVLFHIYNSLFINTSFYVSVIVLIILFFPYHKINYLKKSF